MTQVLTLGLDGAAWHKLDRLMADGRLPNLRALVDDGARAPLRSVYPPVTCPAWRCSTAGKNPGKLGVYWWLDLDRETGDLLTPNARSFDTADVWDYLSEEGYESAVVNVPMTYPPTPIDGVMISGFGAPFELDIDDRLTCPPELQERIEREYDWKVGIDDVTAPEGVEETCDLIESRFELLFDLLDEGYDYLHLTVFYINVLQHKFGDGPETRRGWELIDRYLGELPDDIVKILYSDHGHSTIENTFVINRYLIDRGYLQFEERTGDSLTGGLYEALNRVGISPRRVAGVAENVIPDDVFERLITSGYPVPTSELAGRVNWEESRALALSQGPLYLNRDLLGDEYESFRESLREDLQSLSIDGKSPLQAVHRAEDVYTGEHLDAAPDLMLVLKEGWEMYGGVTPSVTERQANSWTSGNHLEGMVLLHGPGVESGEFPEQSLLDVMPTVLRYVGCPVPSDVDGTAMEAAFDGPLPDTGTREPLAPDEGASEQYSLFKDRLQDLGYLE